MWLAGLLASTFLFALVVGDWVQFTSLSSLSARYGCRIARQATRLPREASERLGDLFAHGGVLHLTHGVSPFFPEEDRILVRPQYQFFSLQFRTAWPLKGSIAVQREPEATHFTCYKLVPWSSALLTLLWFLVVAAGTVAFLVTFIQDGGLASLSGVFMALGITGLGALVFAFGLIIVTLAYRLEDHRLSQVYQELLGVLTGKDPLPRRNNLGRPWAPSAQPSPELP